MQFGLRAMLVMTLLVALMVSAVIGPEIRRTSAFRQLKDNGVETHAPPVVLFAGPQRTPHDTPEPEWLAVRQRINNFIGIKTVPWYADGDLYVPPMLEGAIADMIRDLDDLKAMREWDIHDAG